jgi:PAS domain S-box-containing protein
MSEGFAVGEVILDAQGRAHDFCFLEINAAFERQSGLTRAILGKPARQCLPQLEPVWIENYCSVAMSGRPLHFDAPNADTQRHYDVFCYSPGPRQFAIIFTDITERKATEAAMKRTADRFALLSDAATTLLAAPDPQAMVESLCHRAMTHLDCDVFVNFMASPGERQLWLNAAAGLPPDKLEAVQKLRYGEAVCGCVAAELRAIVAEHIAEKNDACTRFVAGCGVQAYCCHPLMGGGRLLGTLSFGSTKRSTFDPADVETMRAIAGLVAMAMERIRSERVMRDSELFYRQTLESIPGMVFTTRPDGYCDFQSQQWAEYTGVPVSEHLGDGWNTLLHPDDRPRAYAAWREAVEGRAPYNLEYRVRRHDGDYEWFKVMARPIRDADGRIVRWFGVAANINELKAAEEALQRAKAAAESASQAKDQFIAVLSHELRTPLTPAVAAVALLQHDQRLPMDAREDLQTVARNLDLEVRLIADLLDVSRIITGKLFVEKQETDVAEAIRQAASVVSGDIDAKGQTLTLELPPTPCYAFADAARLQQVFWNLLRNAVKFSPERARIEVRARVMLAQEGCGGVAAGDGSACEQCMSVEVSDQGIGIAPETLPRLFSPFEQEAKARALGGLGLGLSICRAVVQNHGGTITAQSAGPGRGATFTVCIPLLRLPSGARPIPAAPQDWALGRRSIRPRRVLLVEDHADTAKLMRRVLAAEGHEVLTATTLAEALQLARRSQPELIISDLGLPDGSGLDLLRQLRTEGSAVPAIALSGYGTAEDVRRSTEAGFALHLVKPLHSLDVLRTAMARLCAEASVADAPSDAVF